MAAYVPLQLVSFPRKPLALTSEQRQWKKYRNALLRQDFAAVTSVAVSPSLYAVTSSTRVRLFDYTNSPQGNLSRFKTQALGGDFRGDGELLAAGDLDGLLHVFQVRRKAVLKTFKHKAAVHAVKFASDGCHVASGSDDYAFRLFDLAMKHPVYRQDGAHEDYIRCVQQVDDSVFASGGLDSAIKLWDVRQRGSVQTLTHSAPLSALLCLGDTLISAGYVRLTFWDLRKGGEVAQLTPHSKNITSLALDSTATRLVTGSMDCSVKVHDLSTHEVTYSLKYPSPVTAAALTVGNAHLVVGMSDGKLSVRQKPGEEAERYNTRDEVEDEYLRELAESQKAMQASERVKDSKYFHRGPSEKPEESDIQTEKAIRTKLSEYDTLLKKFRYGEVLDCALRTQRPEIIVSVLQELEQRNVLTTALRNRTPAQVCELLAWATSRLGSPKYSEVLLGVLGLLLEMYGSVAQVDADCLSQLVRLRDQVDEEYEVEKRCLEAIGLAESLIQSDS